MQDLQQVPEPDLELGLELDRHRALEPDLGLELVLGLEQVPAQDQLPEEEQDQRQAAEDY